MDGKEPARERATSPLPHGGREIAENRRQGTDDESGIEVKRGEQKRPVRPLPSINSLTGTASRQHSIWPAAPAFSRNVPTQEFSHSRWCFRRFVLAYLFSGRLARACLVFGHIRAPRTQDVVHRSLLAPTRHRGAPTAPSIKLGTSRNRIARGISLSTRSGGQICSAHFPNVQIRGELDDEPIIGTRFVGQALSRLKTAAF